MKTASPSFDYAAVAISTLCLVHCLLLSVFAVALPLAGVLSEMEWLHRLFVVLALPLSLLAFVSSASQTNRVVLWGLALSGGLFLFSGAFVHALHDYEVVLTVVGALLLGSAHSVRILTRRHLHH